VILLTLVVSPSLVTDISAQQDVPIHQQWKKFSDIDMLTCKSGYLLLQKSNGNPACVMASTYLKLVDRGYGSHNQSMMEKNPEMMNYLMNSMASNEKIMHHWHEMLQKNPNMMMQTMNDWVSQMKENPELLKNMLAPMTAPEFRDQMIYTMKNHHQMENHLKSHSEWMNSVHQPMGSGMGQGMHKSDCMWCSDYNHDSMNSHGMMMPDSSKMMMSDSSKMMDMIHHIWINSEMTQDMHTMMLEDPSHMTMMSKHMMEPMLNSVMDDEYLREQMIELMLEHKDFMNSIRHENPKTDN